VRLNTVDEGTNREDGLSGSVDTARSVCVTTATWTLSIVTSGVHQQGIWQRVRVMIERC
jgi:hypothetical protein